MKKQMRPLVVLMMLLAATLGIAFVPQVEAQRHGRLRSKVRTRPSLPTFSSRVIIPTPTACPQEHQRGCEDRRVIADVTVTQVYKNEGKKTLEAVYIFPGSTRAAVHAMRMTIGGRVIEAEIMKREEARRPTKRRSRTAGPRPSLSNSAQRVPDECGQHPPGDEIQVVLRYTELIEPEEAVYEFVYPTVVGPRYSNALLRALRMLSDGSRTRTSTRVRRRLTASA